jgi:hypothetical protein
MVLLSALLDSDSFGEFVGFVDVAAVSDGDVVGARFQGFAR